MTTLDADGRRAAIYARRSTAEQDESIARQVDECERLIEANGWQAVHVFTDTASGWRPDTPRPQFDAMMRAAGNGDIDVLVVWEASRLSRQAADRSALSIVWRLQSMGVEVCSVTEKATGVGLADDLTLLIKSHAAKEESDSKSRRVQSGKRLGVLRGIHQGRWAPFGYREAGRRFVGERAVKAYEPDAAMRTVVDSIFRMYVVEGMSPQQIANALDATGTPPPRADGFHTAKRRGQPEWHQSTIRDLIANPLLAGFASYKGGRVKACRCADLDTPAAWDVCEHEWVRSANVPPIVDEATWDAAQAVLASRRRRVFGGRSGGSSDRFLLLGLVWCGHCGERMGCRADQRKGRGRHHYVCRGKRLGRCDLPKIDQAEMDEAVRASFVDGFVDSLDLEKAIKQERRRLLAERNAEASVIREEIVEATKQRREFEIGLTRVADDYMAARIDADQFARIDRDLRARLDDASARIDRLEKRRDEVETARSIDDIDALLDHFSSIQRILSGRLTADDVPRLNGQLSDVFAEFVVTRSGDRIIVEPHLRPEWMPDGSWTTLDFGSDDHDGDTTIEVVDHVGAVMRRATLGVEGLTTPTDSSGTAAGSRSRPA